MKTNDFINELKHKTTRIVIMLDGLNVFDADVSNYQYWVDKNTYGNQFKLINNGGAGFQYRLQRSKYSRSQPQFNLNSLTEIVDYNSHIDATSEHQVGEYEDYWIDVEDIFLVNTLRQYFVVFKTGNYYFCEENSSTVTKEEVITMVNFDEYVWRVKY